MSELTLPKLGAEITTLDNGATLILREDASAPVVSMQGWCATGSIHEGRWLGAGLSHILEHMLFKGTESRAASAVATEVAAQGGHINAYTSFERTVYYIDGPSSGAGVCLDVLMEVVAKATIPPEEFEREQEVIRREFAMLGDDPDRVASSETFATVFRAHPYGVPVIGYLDVFNQLTREDVLAYYRGRYAPNNLFFVVVGDIEARRVREQFEQFFAALPRRPLAPVYVPEEPAQLARRERFKEFATPVTKLSMAWRAPGLTHPHAAALDVLACILGDGRSSRLHREVREHLGLVHHIDAYSYTPLAGGLFAIGADVDPAKRVEAESAVRDTLARVLDEGIAEEEVEKARKTALMGQLGALVTASGQAADIGSGWLNAGDIDFSAIYLRRLATIDAGQVLDAAREHLVDTGLSVVEVGQRAPSAAPAVFVPTAASGVEQFQMANGLQVVVEQDKRLPLLAVSAAFRAGLLAETGGRAGATALLASCLLQGTDTRDAAEIASAVEGRGGSISAGGGNNSLYLNAALLAEDAATVFEIAADVLKAASLPEAAVARERQAQLAAIEEDEARPTGAAFRAVKRALFGDHAYALSRIGDASSVAALDPGALKAFRDQHLAAANGVLAVCGDIDPGRARELAEQGFADLRQGGKAFPEPPVPNWPAVAVERTEHRDKEQAVAVVAVPGISLASPDRAAIDLIEQICSGMDGRLFLRIREDLGLAYFTGATQLVGLAPGALTLYAGTRPDVAEDVLAELLAELAKLATDGPTEDELTRAKAVLAGRHCLEKQSPSARAQGAALDVLYGLGYGHDSRHLERLQSLGRDAVTEAAERFLGESAPKVCVKVVPGER